MKLYIVVLVAFCFSERFAYTEGYAVCGDATYKAEEVDKAIDEVIRRLMALRAPDWSWTVLTTATAIQVAAPKRLFGRNKIVKLVKDIVRYDWDYLAILDLSELAVLARALCMDPRKISRHDLLEKVHDRMHQFVANTSKVEKEHVLAYSLALASLCLNSYPVQSDLVEALLQAQNSDGSFGPDQYKLEATIFMIRPMFCLTRMENPPSNTTKVHAALESMRNYTKLQVNKTEHGAYIGPDEITSSDALISLYKSRRSHEDPNTLWFCRDVMDTLGLHPKDTDNEYDLYERLMRLTGTDLLDLQLKDYKCVKTDPIPKGYKPTCNYADPHTCGIKPDNSKSEEFPLSTTTRIRSTASTRSFSLSTTRPRSTPSSLSRFRVIIL